MITMARDGGGLRSRRPWLSTMLAGAAVCLLVGCAGSGAVSSPVGDIIREEEITKWGSIFSNAYQIVEQLRPQWLRQGGEHAPTPGPGMIDYIVVYEDRTPMGDPDVLRTIPAQSVREIQRYRTGESLEFSPPDHPYGTIVVRTRGGS